MSMMKRVLRCSRVALHVSVCSVCKLNNKPWSLNESWGKCKIKAKHHLEKAEKELTRYNAIFGELEDSDDVGDE